jgi:hypothetical protein
MFKLKFDKSYQLVKMQAVKAEEEEKSRTLTDQERSKIAEALAAQGCSGGKLKFDDGEFEVDGAACEGGKLYDLKFDPSFRLLAKEREE